MQTEIDILNKVNIINCKFFFYLVKIKDTGRGSHITQLRVKY